MQGEPSQEARELLAREYANVRDHDVAKWLREGKNVPGTSLALRAIEAALNDRAALQAIEHKGFVIVPREPTEAMLEAVKPWPAHWPKDGPDYPARWAAYKSDQMAFQSQWRTALAAMIQASPGE